MGIDFDPIMWFVCRLCRQVFPDTDKLKAHKLHSHLASIPAIKCVIVEERFLDYEWSPSDNFDFPPKQDVSTKDTQTEEDESLSKKTPGAEDLIHVSTQTDLSSQEMDSSSSSSYLNRNNAKRESTYSYIKRKRLLASQAAHGLQKGFSPMQSKHCKVDGQNFNSNAQEPDSGLIKKEPISNDDDSSASPVLSPSGAGGGGSGGGGPDGDSAEGGLSRNREFIPTATTSAQEYEYLMRQQQQKIPTIWDTDVDFHGEGGGPADVAEHSGGGHHSDDDDYDDDDGPPDAGDDYDSDSGHANHGRGPHGSGGRPEKSAVPGSSSSHYLSHMAEGSTKGAEFQDSDLLPTSFLQQSLHISEQQHHHHHLLQGDPTLVRRRGPGRGRPRGRPSRGRGRPPGPGRSRGGTVSSSSSAAGLGVAGTYVYSGRGRPRGRGRGGRALDIHSDPELIRLEVQRIVGQRQSQRHLRQQQVLEQKCFSEDRPFQCPHCPVALKSKTSLNRHLVVHGTITKFTCQFCGKSCISNHALSDHERTHTGDRPFRCEVSNCTDTFISKTALNMHTKRKHSEELGLERFSCPVCGKIFGLKSELSKHIMVHPSSEQNSGLTCGHEGCTMEFKTKGQVAEHMEECMWRY